MAQQAFKVLLDLPPSCLWGPRSLHCSLLGGLQPASPNVVPLIGSSFGLELRLSFFLWLTANSKAFRPQCRPLPTPGTPPWLPQNGLAVPSPWPP